MLPLLAQLALALAAFAAAPFVARRGPRPVRVGWLALALAAMLLWPLFRVLPVHAVGLLGPWVVAHVELTGIIVPAAMFFGLAARLVPRAADRRAMHVLLALAAAYAVRAGLWMTPFASDFAHLPPTRMQGGVCLQSDDSTCVAASLVTLLHALRIPAQEAEMARLAGVEPGAGATDSRALLALQRKLAGTPSRARYASLDQAALIAAPKPALVQLGWGFFTSHMVTVLAADERGVTLGDPLSGRRDLPWTEFLAQWKGQAILVAPAEVRGGPAAAPPVGAGAAG